MPSKMTDQEKTLLGLCRRLESDKSRDDLVFQAQTMVRAQDAMKEDYGLVGPDAPFFNGTGAVPRRPGPSDPTYAMARGGPKGRTAAALAREALNG